MAPSCGYDGQNADSRFPCHSRDGMESFGILGREQSDEHVLLWSPCVKEKASTCWIRVT